jgi:hypothetical protein
MESPSNICSPPEVTTAARVLRYPAQ